MKLSITRITERTRVATCIMSRGIRLRVEDKQYLQQPTCSSPLIAIILGWQYIYIYREWGGGTQWFWYGENIKYGNLSRMFIRQFRDERYDYNCFWLVTNCGVLMLQTLDNTYSIIIFISTTASSLTKYFVLQYSIDVIVCYFLSNCTYSHSSDFVVESQDNSPGVCRENAMHAQEFDLEWQLEAAISAYRVDFATCHCILCRNNHSVKQDRQGKDSHHLK